MDVCISHDYDGANDFYTERVVTARKPHRCVECGEVIAIGARYERVSLKNIAGFYTEATCLLCVEIRRAFVCGAYVFGMLWDSIEEELFPRWRSEGPFECLAKLSTPEARAFCQSRFAEWEADRV
jgi:hypothetical protein